MIQQKYVFGLGQAVKNLRHAHIRMPKNMMLIIYK